MNSNTFYKVNLFILYSFLGFFYIIIIIIHDNNNYNNNYNSFSSFLFLNKHSKMYYCCIK